MIKFGCIEIKKKFHQNKKLVSIKKIDINKIVVSNKVKRVLHISWAIQRLKKLNLHVYFSQNECI